MNRCTPKEYIITDKNLQEKRNLFYIYVWNKRITLKILPCMAALNTFRTDGEDFGEQILSKVVKAGRRTYFLDVRATRANDYFLYHYGEPEENGAGWNGQLRPA